MKKQKKIFAMSKIKYPAISFLTGSVCVIISLLLIKQHRSDLKKNDGFSVGQIYSSFKPTENWNAEVNSKISTQELSSILSKEFFYLGKGHQSFVFENKADQIVIKFYKFPSEMRSFAFLAHPLSGLKKKRKEIIRYNLDKYHKTKESHKLAFNNFFKESKLLSAQLSKTLDCPYEITIVDRIGNKYKVLLKNTHFLIQKKGSLLFDQLDKLLIESRIEDIKEIISNTVDFMQKRALGRIIDLDPAIEKNFGLIAMLPFQLDTGRLAYNLTEPTKEEAYQEALHLTAPIKEWVISHAPSLLEYYTGLFTEL